MVYTRGLISEGVEKKLKFCKEYVSYEGGGSNPLLLILNENHVLKYFGFLYEHF